MDTGSKFTGTSGADTFSGIDTGLATTTTVNTGDSLTGGNGVDRLEYSTSGATAGGAIVSTTGVEELSVFNSSTAGYNVNASLMAGLTDVYVTGGASALTVSNGTTAPNLHLISVNQNATVAPIATAVAGTADAVTVLSNGSATTANVTATYDGIETINFKAAGATGSSTTALTLSSNALTTLNMTGDAAARVSAGLPGATAAITGTVTSDAGAHDVTITGVATTDKLSVSMGGGNDTVRVSDVVALYTIAGGDGTDTLRYDGAAAVTLATTANVSGFEQVVLSNAAPASFAMTGAGISKVTYTNAAAGTFGGMTTGGELNLNAGGSVTVAAAGAAASATAAQILAAATYSGTADSLTVNVGSATAATGAAASTVSAVGIERVTFNSLAASTSTEARTVTFSDTGTTPTLSSITVTSAIPALTTVSATGTALATVDLSGVAGGASFSGGRATGTSITGGIGNDVLTGGAGNDVITSGDGNDTVGGSTGADSIVAGAGNDSITGGVGADTMTGGLGNDVFVFDANATGAVVSTASALDTITDFVSGTDKLSITNITTGAPTKFLNNYATYAAGNAAALADGTAGLAFFVTGENTLYVQAVAGTLGANDTAIKLEGVTSITAADLFLGSQGTGSAISITAPGVLSTTANAGATAVTTDFDDTITQGSTVAVGTGVANGSVITGGLGYDTYNVTIATQAGLTSLATSGANTTSTNLNSIERANITVTLPAATVNVGTLDTELQVVTLTSSNADGSLTATTSAAGQTVTVTNTAGTTASAITVGNFANQTITTGSAGDTITVNGGAATTGLTVNSGAGADTIVASAATVLSGALNVLNGGTNVTGTVDVLELGYDLVAAGPATLALPTLITNGTIVGIEGIKIADQTAGAAAANQLTITAGTGIVSYDASLSNDANDTIVINATAAQADAMTSVVFDANATSTLNITSAGSVSFAGNTTTAIDTIAWQDIAVDLTLNNTANTVSQGATAPGTAAQTVTFGDGSAIQSATIRSTGAVTFNVTAAALAAVAAADVDGTESDGEALQTFSAAADATAVINVTGAGGSFTLLDTAANGDEDLVITNIDTVNINTTSASTIVGGVGTDEIDFTLNLGAVAGHTVVLDSAGTANSSVTITGFAAGTGGDIIQLNEATTADLPGNDITTFSAVATTGYTLPATAAAGAIVTVLNLTGSAFQVSGALTLTGDAGAVEAAILAAGLITPAGNASNIYVILDNGTDTGLYRVAYDEAAADGANAGVLNLASEISVQLIATLVGVSDNSNVVAANLGLGG